NRELWELKPDQLEELFRKPGAPEGDAGADKQAADTKKPADPAASLTNASFTDLRLPLARALERTGPGQGKILGVVLLTDGQHNAGDPPNKKARELGERKVPIYPIALGALEPPPDVAIISLKAPHAVFKDVEATIDVRFKI